ncbi:hypothetical protein O9X98_08565 [Agrobacterium salinitolerans]|nr:hypothetical protein [Agrobacterium salinitolerans]
MATGKDEGMADRNDRNGARAERRSRRLTASPRLTPDYSRLKAFEALPEELAAAGASDVRDLVSKMNRVLISRGQLPISHGDYPTTRKRLVKLLERWKRSAA